MADFSQLVPERYRIFYSKEQNVFRVLDTWHPIIKNLNLEENPDIPDNSPAIKLISGEEVNALIGELIKLGWLDKLISAKMQNEIKAAPRNKSTTDLIVEKITEITLDDRGKPESHGSVSKDAVSALKEIASKISGA